MRESLNITRREIKRALRDRGKPLQGIISAYDPATYRAKVIYQPSLVESNWLPIGSAWVGNGWGMLAPPPSGTQVSVIFQEEDKDSGIIAFGLFDDGHTPPVGSPQVQQGEFLLWHQSGAFLKFLNIGDINISSPTQINLTAPVVNVNGNLVVTGNTSSGSGLTGSFTTATGQIVTVQNGIITGIV